MGNASASNVTRRERMRANHASSNPFVQGSAMAKATGELLHVAGHDVTVSNPGKVYFPEAGITKLELVRYYLDVAEGALRGVQRRPMVLKRYVNGQGTEPFFQKRAPAKLPPFVGIATFDYASGRHADECVVSNAAALVWV